MGFLCFSVHQAMSTKVYLTIKKRHIDVKEYYFSSSLLPWPFLSDNCPSNSGTDTRHRTDGHKRETRSFEPSNFNRWQLGTSKIDWFSSIGRRRSQAFCFHFTTKKVERSPLPRTFLSWRAPADREFNTWRGASFGIARRAILMIRGRSHLLYYNGESSFWTSMLPH